jgi:hypothetical protein
MRGEDQIQGAMFSCISPEQRVPEDHPLRMIWVLTDAALQDLSPLFGQPYSRLALAHTTDLHMVERGSCGRRFI